MWPVALYWCFIEVGTPPRRFPVAIDSGSPFLAIAGEGCDGCATSAPNNAYNARESLTSEPADATPSSPTQPGFVETPADGAPGSIAHFHYSYTTCDLKHPTAPCSISGALFQDEVSIAGLGPVTTAFGQIMNQTNNFDQFKVINGVMGILPPMKGYSKRNLFHRLVEEGLCDNVWALCLHQGSLSTGSLTLGGVDMRLVDGPITYVPNTASFYAGKDLGVLWMYGVHVRSVRVGDKAFEVGHTAVMDSGTNILLLPRKLHDAVKDWMCTDSMFSFCKELWNHTCQSMTPEQIDAYPQFHIELDGVSLEMSPRDYILLGSPLAKSPDQYCIGIRDGGDNIQGFMIGDTTLRNYYVVHDIGNERIGWGKVNRETCGSVGEPDADESEQNNLFFLGAMGRASGELPVTPEAYLQGLSQIISNSGAQPVLLLAAASALGFVSAGCWWGRRTRANARNFGGHYVSIE